MQPTLDVRLRWISRLPEKLGERPKILRNTPERIAEMASKVQKLVKENGLHRVEGSKGVSNLCKLVSLLGYKDPQYNGSLSEGGHLGDLMCFLEDNPGAIEAIVTWAEENEDCFALDDDEESLADSELDESEEEDVEE